MDEAVGLISRAVLKLPLFICPLLRMISFALNHIITTIRIDGENITFYRVGWAIDHGAVAIFDYAIPTLEYVSRIKGVKP